MKQYGQYVSLIRQRLGFTQKEFAEFLVCDQGTISKIESGEILYGDIINQIAWKLGVHPKEFIETNVEQLEDFDYVKETKNYIRYLVEKRDYISMIPYVEDCWNNQHFHSKKDQVFLHWNQGIIDIHYKNDTSAAIEHIKEALKLTLYSETFLNYAEILNSYSIVHLVIGDLETARHFLEKAEGILSALRLSQGSDVSTRILYNLSNTYFHLNKFKESQRKAYQAIQLCKERKSTYLRGEVVYQYGYSSYYLGLKDKAKEYMEKSIIYLIDGDQEELAQHVVQKLHELEF